MLAKVKNNVNILLQGIVGRMHHVNQMRLERLHALNTAADAGGTADDSYKSISIIIQYLIIIYYTSLLRKARF